MKAVGPFFAIATMIAKKFPLVLLQVKAVGKKRLTYLSEREVSHKFPLVLLQVKAVGQLALSSLLHGESVGSFH